MDNPDLAIWLLAPGMFFGTMPFGAGPAAIPAISPPFFRAQLVAVYLLVANLLGQAGGPWVVAMLTDNVFERPEAIGSSLAIAVTTLLLLGSALAAFGCRPLRERLMPRETPDGA